MFLLVRQKGTPKTTTPLGVIVSVQHMPGPPATIFLYFSVVGKVFIQNQGSVAKWWSVFTLFDLQHLTQLSIISN